MGNTEGKKSVERHRRRWDHGNKICLRELVWDLVDWINLVQSRGQWRAIVNTAMNFRVP
jgi:hypothetical protein